MLELYEFFIDNRNKPLEYILLAALLFIGDRLGRKFITSQVKRLFRVDDRSDFYHYVQNQRRIESKLDAIMSKEGIAWSAPTLNPDLPISQTKRKKSYLMPWAALSHVRAAKQYITWRLKRMSNINRGILLPLLSAIALFVKQVWGFEISDEQIDMYADIALYLIMFIGLFMKPKKEGKPKDEQLDFTDGPAA